MSAGKCHGNTDEHCCFFEGIDCPYVEENTVEGRRWACGLRRELGSWEAVEQDLRYRVNVQPKLDKLSERMGQVVSCANYPPPGVKCYCTENAE